jgi:coenzyme F420-reducing hydrogenase beta subunit
MVEDGFGEYRPHALSGSCPDCGLCREVCPFERGPNENDLGRELYAAVEGVQHTPETGYFLSCYCGGVSSDALRRSRTSGGLATWMLTRLMEAGIVDRVISVASTSNPDRLFEFAEFPTVESLWSAARSSYYPVEISFCLRTVAQSKLRYAVIGLPCVVKGIRRAQRGMPRLKRNIPVVLGLVCGHQCSKWFAEYVVRRVGLPMPSVRRISFREKCEDRPAGNPGFAAWTEEEALPATVNWNQGYGSAWDRSYFKQHACNYCDDAFAELADAAFMDAWLPEFQHDPRGTSIVLARAVLCRELVSSGVQSGALRMAPLDIRQVIRSQKAALHQKRDGAALQASLDGDRGVEFHPRVQPAPWWRVIARYRKASENRRTAASRAALIAQRAAGPGIETFRETMKKSTAADTIVLSALDLLADPKCAVRRAIRLAVRVATRFLCRIKVCPALTR